MSANKFPRRRSTALGAAECDPIDTEASTESALQERVASLEASLEKMQKLHGKDVEETVTPLEVEATVAESVESALVQEISVDANLAAVEVEEEPRTEEVAPDTVAGAMVQPTVADSVDESEADVEEEHKGDDDDGKKEEANEEEANENATADEESTTADEVVDEEVVDDDKGDDKGNHLIDNLMTRVAQLEKKKQIGTQHRGVEHCECRRGRRRQNRGCGGTTARQCRDRGSGSLGAALGAGRRRLQNGSRVESRHSH